MGKLDIYMDTNILKIIEPNLLEFSFNETYKKLKEFIIENEYKNINIIISKIVIEELIQQYIESYEIKYNDLPSDINNLLNNCFSIGWNLKVIKNNKMTLEKYKKYIRKAAVEYVKEQNNIVLDFPRQRFESIIERAIRKQLPFLKGKGKITIDGEDISGKEFSDAGFKDVIFLESIIEYSKRKKNELLILTKDKELLRLNWRKELCKDNIIVKDIDQGNNLVKFICEHKSIKDFSVYKKFSKTEYYKTAIFNAINKKVEKTLDIKENNNDDITYIDILNNIRDENGIYKYTVRLNEGKEFIEILNEDSEVIYEW